MKKIIKKILMITTISVMIITSLIGCGKKDVKSIIVSGSTSILPLMEKLAEKYEENNPNVKIEVQSGGSSVGIKNCKDGISDIGMASRDLKESEKKYNLTPHIIAVDGISIVLHPSNGVKNLTKEQVQKIFKEELTNWNQVGGADMKISIISRESGSGTRSAFEEIMNLVGDDKSSLVSKNALTQDSNGSVRSTVAGTKGAIGYMSMGLVDNTVKAIKINGEEPNSKNAKNGTYIVKRNFLLVTKGELSEDVKKFIEFIKNEGQEIVKEKYISIK